jgi:CheY-like chemotaxis protein
VAHPLATILIVDDLPENLTVLGGLLLPLYRVKVANSGVTGYPPLPARILAFRGLCDKIRLMCKDMP